MSAAAPRVDSDVEILQALDFEAHESCEMGKCQQVATHLVICKCANGSGYSCSEHAAWVRDSKSLKIGKITLSQNRVLFHRTCGHRTPVSQCRVQPL